MDSLTFYATVLGTLYQYGTLIRLSVDSIVKIFRVELTDSATHVSWEASTSSLFYNVNVRAMYYLTIRFCKSSLNDHSIDDCLTWVVCLFTCGAAPLEVRLLAGLSRTWRDTPASAMRQSCGCSNMIAYCSKWTAGHLRGLSRISLANTNGDMVDGLTKWAISLSISAMISSVAYV